MVVFISVALTSVSMRRSFEKRTNLMALPDSLKIFRDQFRDRETLQSAEEMQRVIEENVEAIRTLVAKYSTQGVIGYCSWKGINITFPNPELSSPMKQIYFLIGVLLETDEPVERGDFGSEEWEQVTIFLQRIFDAYNALYEHDFEANQSHDTQNFKTVAALAFANYFFTTLIASVDQMRNRIKRVFTQFDDELTNEFGLDASAMLEIANWICDKIANQWTNVERQVHALNKLSTKDKATFDEMVEEMNRMEECDPAREVLENRLKQVQGALDEMTTVDKSELAKEFGSIGLRFWNLFVITRGDGLVMTYPTETSIIEMKPLVRIDQTTAMCLSMNALFAAIIIRSDKILSSCEARSRYFEKRAEILEEDAALLLAQLLGESCKVYPNMFETNDSQGEHDAVLISEGLFLILEAKSSPRKEPFRDLEKAYTRLTRAYRSDTGIQHAYEQANRLVRRLKKEREVSLFDINGKETIELTSDMLDRLYIVCATFDNFGSMATFQSWLLNKDAEDPYPWTVNLFDLENVLMLWSYFGWDWRQLRVFLENRVPLNESVFSEDELVYVGAFVKYCGLHQLGLEDDALTMLDSDLANMFDQIQRHLRGETKRVRIDPTQPASMELSAAGEFIPGDVSWDDERSDVPVGRNVSCPCGSGVKFKRCHGR